MPVGSTLPFALLSMALAVDLAQAQEPSPETAQNLGTLREALIQATYGVEHRDGAPLEAHNAAQGLRFAFEEGGVEVSAVDEAGGAWNARLTVEAVGRPGAMLPVEPALPVASGRRVEYRRGPLTEWYVNCERGLEQGFVFGERPAGEGALEIALALDSGLAVEITPSGRDALLTNGATGRVLHYSGLRAWDAEGCELEASLAVEDDRLSIRVADEGATYPVNVDPWISTEEAKLVASDGAAGDSFGAVAISGDTCVVGARYDDHTGGLYAGSAYVFVRSGTTWTEQAKLTASDAAPSDHFGHAVAIDGDTIVVGAEHGSSTYVFVRNGATWTEQAKLVASNPGEGWSVAVSGDTALVGDPGALGFFAGRVSVFVRSGTTWTEHQELVGSGMEAFGWSVALWGDNAVIGAPGNSFTLGEAYVFVRTGTVWSEQQKLIPSDPGFTSFSSSVAGWGDTVAVGNPGNLFGASGSGYVFVRTGTVWSEQQKLVASDAASSDDFGRSVALLGDAVVFGAESDDHAGGNNAGSAYLFTRSGSTWSEQQKLVASDAAAGDGFGGKIAIGGDTLLVGALGDDDGGINSGAAYVFRLAPAPAATYCTGGTSASGCQALISATGTPSASAPSGFALHASAVEGAVDGLFFWGTNGRQANPWGNGTSFQCVVPPLVRGAMQAGGGTSGACDGSFTLDLNAFWCSTCPKAHKNPGAGTVVQAQLWYVDPLSTSNQPTSLSDAIEFGVGP